MGNPTHCVESVDHTHYSEIYLYTEEYNNHDYTHRITFIDKGGETITVTDKFTDHTFDDYIEPVKPIEKI